MFSLELGTANYSSSDNIIRQKPQSNTTRREHSKDVLEITKTRVSEKKKTSSNHASILPVVTRTGQVVKGPQRLQLEVLSSS